MNGDILNNATRPEIFALHNAFYSDGQSRSRGDSIHAPQDVIQKSAMSLTEQSSTDAQIYLPVNHFHEYSIGALPTHSAWSEFISPGHLSLPKILMVESFEVILQRYFMSEPLDKHT